MRTSSRVWSLRRWRLPPIITGRPTPIFGRLEIAKQPAAASHGGGGRCRRATSTRAVAPAPVRNRDDQLENTRPFLRRQTS
jgi:hypothetical protein